MKLAKFIIPALFLAFVAFILMAPEAQNPTGLGVQLEGNRPERGIAPPDFTLTDLDGKTWTLSALKGSVVVINFWATWCPPCRKELPSLNATFNRYAGADDFQVLTILYQDTPADAKKYFAEEGYKMPILIDDTSKVAEDYGLSGVPETYIVDKAGNLVKFFVGPMEFDSPDALQYFDKLLGHGVSNTP
jgi:cytochrome c biogenesis protein CcmG/thiol:disulfide interchange protein DsbE